MSNIRQLVFWPTIILSILTVFISLFFPKYFLEKVSGLNEIVINVFGPFFSISSLMMFFVCIIIFFSPIGNLIVGGENARPILNRWRLFSITLCTTIATGILFWGTAEPIYHFSSPPVSSNIVAESNEAAVFAMSTLYLHWSFTPYAIYSIPTIIFALAFYNRKSSFSLSSMLFPFYKKNGKGPSIFMSNSVDTLCLFSLVAGMSASLGTGILTLSGGIQNIFGIEKSSILILLICFIIVFSFVLSASTGVMKGIRILSSINVYAFILIAIIFLLFGSLSFIVSISLKGFGDYMVNFFEKSTYNIIHPNDSWANNWTVFFWANWMAWAPISAMFLGKIAKGYKVKEVLFFNWILPSVFSIIWMSIFGATALGTHINGQSNLIVLLNESGYESIVYAIMNLYPYSKYLAGFFIFIVYLSYVTAADSNTEAMGAISVKNFNAENDSAPIFIKIIWGVCIGSIAYIMVNSSGVEGIKMLSNLGGVPALFLLTFVMIGMCIIIVRSYSKDFEL